MGTRGWAIEQGDGEILVQTVGHSPVSAMVNWIVLYGGMMVMNEASDEEIGEAFIAMASQTDAVLVEVDISTVEKRG